MNTVSACAFSHDGHRLCTASWDKCLQVYDIASGAYRYSYRQAPLTAAIVKCMFHAYRLEGAVVLKGHDGCVSSCDFSSDG